MAPRAGNALSNAEMERERQKYRARLSSALTDEDDPLAAYHQFVQWTIKNYGENNPKSGLKDLLMEATSQFRDDPLYKTDLRYLKLWALYARQVDKTGALAIYASLLANDIGTSYSALYEDYANLLEGERRREEAEAVYRKGIQKSARPLERLKMRYKEFQSRSSLAHTESSSAHPPSHATTSKNATNDNPASTSKATVSSTLQSTSFKSTSASRYAVMLAPPDPGKRPEKFRCKMSLLFTAEGVEFSIQEARARSMGLLGKKWGPPPPSDFGYSSASSSSSSSSTSTVDFSGSRRTTSRLKSHARKSLLSGAEPTVTINTKEALADVFGMYNSPDKTVKLAMPGSKHAPLKKVEPVTPLVPPKVTILKENENSHNARTPATTFRPFVDENSQSNANRTPKFPPFVDPGQQNKTPFMPRQVLSVKETAPLTNPRSENAPPSLLRVDERSADPVFAKVFIPASRAIPLAPLRDVFTDDHGKPVPKSRPVPTHERAKSQHDIVNPEVLSRPSAFTPFKDENAKTPFKVFTRPPDQENAVSVLTPKPGAAYTPFTNSKLSTLTPVRDNPPSQSLFVDIQSSPVDSSEESSPDEDAEQLEASRLPQEEEQDQDNFDYSDSYEGEEFPVDLYDEPPPEHASQHPIYDEEVSYEEVPLGGRFGQFNVLTPITERTFEFTSSTRGSGTPSERYAKVAPEDAAEVAERLAEELRQDDEDVCDESVDEERPRHRPQIEPLCLGVEDMPPQRDLEVVEIEEKAGALSLLDTLTLSSKFRPNNPCNPFDSTILSSLLSRIPTDPHFHDLRHDNIAKLADLERFIKKNRKSSSGSNNTGILDAGTFPLTLQSHKFVVTEKLGEGGFGTVFKARDVGIKMDGEEDDEDDEFEDDDDDVSMVAIKVVKPRNIWEYHVLRRLHSIIPPALRRTLVIPHAIYAYKEESYLVLDLCPQGMLLDIVNNAISAGVSQPGACLDELLVMFFSIELLRLTEAMHTAGFIHGDLKIDNCLLRLEEVPGGAAGWSGTYQPSGECGWSYKGLKVIDFGRTIDTRLFPPGQQFIADWATDERDCFEIRENKPWTYQTDYFGLAGIIYCMLFGKYIQASSLTHHADEFGVQRHKIATPFKRYWQTDIWNRLFDALLNPCLVKPNGELPISDALAEIRKEMEQWLQSNCNRTSNTLKGLLKKVELSCYRT